MAIFSRTSFEEVAVTEAPKLDSKGLEAARRAYELGLGHSHVDCLKAAISAYLTASPPVGTVGMDEQWRSMDSAPKDGTDILLRAVNQTYEGKPVEDRVTVGHWTSEEECRVDIGDCGGDCHCREYEYVDPTWMSWDGGFTPENAPDGWMPLPPARALTVGTEPKT